MPMPFNPFSSSLILFVKLSFGPLLGLLTPFAKIVGVNIKNEELGLGVSTKSGTGNAIQPSLLDTSSRPSNRRSVFDHGILASVFFSQPSTLQLSTQYVCPPLTHSLTRLLTNFPAYPVSSIADLTNDFPKMRTCNFQPATFNSWAAVKATVKAGQTKSSGFSVFRGPVRHGLSAFQIFSFSAFTFGNPQHFRSFQRFSGINIL
jgi:hypothetical protein